MKSLLGSRLIPSLGLLLTTIWICGVLHSPARAQVPPKTVDTLIVETTRAGLDLGTRTTTLPPDPITNVTTTAITGGSRPDGGSNLFHSFDFFTVGTKDIAHFQNDMMLPTTNIIARVIGDAAGMRQASTIDGILRTNNPLNALDPLNFGSANLFLVNPAGIIFGSNAQLDIKGSFAATTADYLRMTDGVLFHTDPAQPSVLSIANVASFGFTSPRPVAITLDRSILIASPGQTLSFIGGDFSVLGDPGPRFPFIGGFGSRVNIAAVASPGEVIPNSPGAGPDLNVELFTNLGNISMADVSVGVSGFNQNVDPGGAIVVRGNDMTLTDNTALTARGAPGGQINIKGNSLQMLKGSIFSTTTRGAMNHPGDAVNIQLTGDFTLTDGEIASSNVGLGKAGDIRISAANMYFGPDNPNQTFFANFRGDIGSRSFGPGRTGDVEITTPGNLLVKNGFFSGRGP